MAATATPSDFAGFVAVDLVAAVVLHSKGDDNHQISIVGSKMGITYLCHHHSLHLDFRGKCLEIRNISTHILHKWMFRSPQYMIYLPHGRV